MKKKEARAVLTKFEFDVRTKGKEDFARFIHEGKIILTTSVPKGQGDLYVANQFRQQLKLSQDQLRLAIRCPFKRRDYIEHLAAAGLL